MENIECFREGGEVYIQSTRCQESVPKSAPPVEEFEKALRDYALPLGGIPPVIRQPAIQENNFEIKPITLQLNLCTDES